MADELPGTLAAGVLSASFHLLVVLLQSALNIVGHANVRRVFVQIGYRAQNIAVP